MGKYVCDREGCQKRFISMGYYLAHLRAHDGLKPFVCKTCSKGFAWMSNLLAHYQVHDSTRRFACPVKGCGKVFKRAANLRQHTKEKHGDPSKTKPSKITKAKRASKAALQNSNSQEPRSSSTLDDDDVDDEHGEDAEENDEDEDGSNNKDGEEEEEEDSFISLGPNSDQDAGASRSQEEIDAIRTSKPTFHSDASSTPSPPRLKSATPDSIISTSHQSSASSSTLFQPIPFSQSYQPPGRLQFPFFPYYPGYYPNPFSASNPYLVSNASFQPLATPIPPTYLPLNYLGNLLSFNPIELSENEGGNCHSRSNGKQIKISDLLN